jgi:quinol monooxygenase YgiN
VIFIVVKQSVRPKFADDWIGLVDEFTTASRAEPGNICFEWYRSVDDPNVYVLVEAFRDEAAGQAHVESEHFKTASAQLATWLAAVPEIVHVEAPGDGWSPMGEVQSETTA